MIYGIRVNNARGFERGEMFTGDDAAGKARAAFAQAKAESPKGYSGDFYCEHETRGGMTLERFAN